MKMVYPAKEEIPEKRRKKHVGLWILAAVLVLLAALFLDSNLRLTVSRFAVEDSRLPQAFDGFKIVQLSDLHGARFGEDNVVLAAKVLALRPDMIALTGDFISDAKDLPAVQDLLEKFKGVPMYYVTGNHDWASGDIDALFGLLQNCGVTVLHNEWLTLARGGERIVLCGVEDPNSWADLEKPDSVVQRMRAAYPDDYVVFLGHRNYWALRYPELDVDLILCGHSHGGIIRLPFVGGLFGTSKELTTPVHESFFEKVVRTFQNTAPKYEAGLYKTGAYTMIVSRGLGQAPPIPRLLNNPEIVEITLKAG